MPKAHFVNKREAARDDSDDEAEELDYEATYQKDMVLFCIDAGPSMHRINPEAAKSNLHIALAAAASLMEKKLISSPHDHVGVMLFNTAETIFKSAKPGEYYRGSYEIQPVRQVNVPDTFNLKSLLKGMFLIISLLWLVFLLALTRYLFCFPKNRMPIQTISASSPLPRPSRCASTGLSPTQE